MQIAEAPQQYLTEDAIIAQARGILSRRMRRTGAPMTSPHTVREFFALRLSELESEEFHVAFYDTKLRLIKCECLFTGTLAHTAVHPREVVKRALQLNANAVILAHNHPSGETEPSHADKLLTKQLKDALALIDVRTLDHIIVAAGDTMSFAEQGLL